MMLLGLAPSAFAQTPLDVQFVPNPLFTKPNFLPLDETSGTATVTNNSGTTQTILTEAINVSDDDNFGSLLRLRITGGTLFDNTLANFLTTAGEVSLGTISNGESKTFTYTVSFLDSNDNSYQGKSLGFDVCVGFQGGTTHCGDTVIGDEGGGTTGGGTVHRGSSGSTIRTLIIFNEQALDIFNVGSSGIATITWETNLLATSQVIYGLAPGPYTLDVDEPYIGFFGYPLATLEDGTKVINHSMSLTGLTPGATYLYRVVSRASPPTVSAEHQFTVPLLLAQAPNPGSVLGASSRGSVLGNDSNGTTGSVLGETTGEVEGNPSPDENLALSFASDFSDLLSTCNLISLLILLVIYLIWKFWLRRKYEKYGIPEEIFYFLWNFLSFNRSHFSDLPLLLSSACIYNNIRNLPLPLPLQEILEIVLK